MENRLEALKHRKIRYVKLDEETEAQIKLMSAVLQVVLRGKSIFSLPT